MSAKPTSPRTGTEGDDTATVPVPVTPIDRVVLEIRKFIAAAIFFNAQTAERAGLGLTDMQMLHMLQLYGPSTPGKLGIWTGLSSGGVTIKTDTARCNLVSLKKAREPDGGNRSAGAAKLSPGSVFTHSKQFD